MSLLDKKEHRLPVGSILTLKTRWSHDYPNFEEYEPQHFDGRFSYQSIDHKNGYCTFEFTFNIVGTCHITFIKHEWNHTKLPSGGTIHECRGSEITTTVIVE